MKKLLLTLLGLVAIVGVVISPAEAAVDVSSSVATGVPSTALVPNGARSMVRTATGDLWCVYSRLAGGVIQVFGAYSTDGGDTWVEEQISFGADHQRSCAVAADSAGNVHVVWQGKGWGNNPNYYNIQYRVRTTSWQPREAVTDVAGNQANPAIAVDGQDNVHVVWQGQGWGANPAIYNIQYRQKTNAWQSQEAVTDKAQHQRSPSVAVDAAGNVHVVWSGIGWGFNPTIDNIQYRKRAASWQAVEQVSDKTDFQWGPCVAVDPAGNVHVAWYGDGWAPYGGRHQILYRQRGSSSWQACEALTEINIDQNNPSIALDQDGSVYVAWYGKGWGSYPESYSVQYRRRTDCWQAQQAVADGSYDACWPSLVCAVHPAEAGIPASGFALVWVEQVASGYEVKLHRSADLSWEGGVVPSSYALNIEVSGSGTTSPAPGTWAYREGTEVTLSASPAAGWSFDHWSGDVSGTANPTTVTMDADRSVTAQFVQATCSLEAAVDPVGSGSVAADPAEGIYPWGTQVTLTAVPAKGYVFAYWSGDASGTANPTTVTMDADKSVTAHFAPDGTPSGTRLLLIQLEDGSELWPEGTVVTVTCNPDCATGVIVATVELAE